MTLLLLFWRHKNEYENELGKYLNEVINRLYNDVFVDCDDAEDTAYKYQDVIVKNYNNDVDVEDCAKEIEILDGDVAFVKV